MKGWCQSGILMYQSKPGGDRGEETLAGYRCLNTGKDRYTFCVFSLLAVCDHGKAPVH